jgi:hypothetical protein
MRSVALAVLGNAMTSRIELSPARIATMRSSPSAIPPWGDVPYCSASRKKVHREVHREFNFACLAAVHGDGGVGSLIGDRLRVVAVLGLVKRHDGEA